MRENMIYDTKEYQIREGILERMLEIIHNQRKVDTLFFGDSITQYLDIKNILESMLPTVALWVSPLICYCILLMKGLSNTNLRMYLL